MPLLLSAWEHVVLEHCRVFRALLQFVCLEKSVEQIPLHCCCREAKHLAGHLAEPHQGEDAYDVDYMTDEAMAEGKYSM